MKTFNFIAFALFAVLLCLSSCGDKNVIGPNPTIDGTTAININASIITNGLSFNSEKGELSISFTTVGDWNLSIASTTSGEAWCSASATSGTKGTATIYFSVTENTSYDDRRVSATITSGTASKTFTITQKGANALLLTSNKYEVSQEGGTIEIEVKANIDYTVEISESTKNWIHESSSRALSAYKHIFEVDPSEELDKRIGEIYFKSEDKKETVNIYQAGGAIILLSEDEYTVSDAGGTISVDVKSNIEYSVQMPDVDWITDEAATRGMSSHTLKFTIDKNEGYTSRFAEIIFCDKNSDVKNTLKIEQAQKNAIVISNKEIEVPTEGGIIEVKLSANVEFEITMPNVDWIEQVNTRAMQEHKLYFKVAENQELSDRTTRIVFSNKGSKLSDTLTVKQPNNYGTYKCVGNSDGLFATVETYKAGALKRFAEAAYLDYENKYTKLTVIGPINGDDVKILNKLNSSSSKFEIDLTDVTIVEGGESYYSYHDDSYTTAYYTKANEIGSYMFAEAKAKIITLPKSAITISKYAFYKSKIITINTGNGITSISDYAFSGTSSLRNIYIGEGVTKIDDRAFADCSSLMVLDICISVPSISDYAFDKIPVTDIHIGNSVTSIGEESFANCYKLRTVTIGDGVTTIGDRAFESCKTLNLLTIGKSVTTIGDGAFDRCGFLTSIDIPNSVIEIGNNAFAGTSLSYVDIPNSVTLIGNYAFSETDLINVVIPNSVTNIGDYTFYGCSKLTRLYCNATVPPAGSNMLDSGVQVYVPYQSVEAYKTAYNWKKYANYIVGYDCDQDEVVVDFSKCKVGDFINYRGVDCVVFYAEKDAVKLVSASVKSQCKWGVSGQTIGAYDTKDGAANASKAKSQGVFDSLPAFVWCESIGDGWYLPSTGELAELARNRHIVERTLEDMGRSSLLRKHYWSSTETGSSGQYAYSCDFSDNSGNVVTYSSSKEIGYSVRAVMTIKK